MTAPARVLLLDHDDTLVATFAIRARCWSAAVQRVTGAAIDGAAELTRDMGRTVEATALDRTAGDAGLATELVRVYREIYFAASSVEVAAFPGMAETLTALRAHGLRLAVVTSKIRAGAAMELERAGLAPLFDLVVGSDDVRRHKPDPEPLLHALARLGMPAAAAVMVGDTPADLLAARAAGVRAAAALWGALDAALLRDCQPDLLLDRPEALLALAGA